MNIAFACNIFEDAMDGLFIVEGTDGETVREELRYRWGSCHNLSLDPRFPIHLFTQYGPHTTRGIREEVEEGKTKNIK